MIQLTWPSLPRPQPHGLYDMHAHVWCMCMCASYTRLQHACYCVASDDKWYPTQPLPTSTLSSLSTPRKRCTIRTTGALHTKAQGRRHSHYQRLAAACTCAATSSCSSGNSCSAICSAEGCCCPPSAIADFSNVLYVCIRDVCSRVPLYCRPCTALLSFLSAAVASNP